MSIKQSHKPDGYKELLIYKKAHGLLLATTHLTERFPESKTMAELADQMNRSARSVKQNIVEGWKRNTTRQYNEFLGFSIASCAEVKEDCEDIWIGAYGELSSRADIMGSERVQRDKGAQREERGEMGLKRVEGEERAKRAEGEKREERGNERGEKGSNEKGEKEEYLKWVESLKFYPLDESLPSVVRLYLRSKELCYLIDKTQRSLQKKMIQEYGLTSAEKQVMKDREAKKERSYLDNLLAERGQVRTIQGVMSKEEAARRGLKHIKLPGSSL